MTDGFDRAQSYYDAMMPPEPRTRECEASVSATFWLDLTRLEFDVGSEGEQMQEWMQDEFMPRVKLAIAREFFVGSGPKEGPRDIDGEFEVEELR